MDWSLVMVSPALSALCQDKLGIDLNSVSPDQLVDLLPDILLAVSVRYVWI
jgi:hypothetical protein